MSKHVSFKTAIQGGWKVHKTLLRLKYFKFFNESCLIIENIYVWKIILAQCSPLANFINLSIFKMTSCHNCFSIPPICFAIFELLLPISVKFTFEKTLRPWNLLPKISIVALSMCSIFFIRPFWLRSFKRVVPKVVNKHKWQMCRTIFFDNNK